MPSLSAYRYERRFTLAGLPDGWCGYRADVAIVGTLPPAGRRGLESFSRQGLTFRVADRGPRDGPAVVLLHGFPGSAATWAGVTPLLVEGGLRGLAPDQRGYSPQARPPGRRPYRLSELVADVVALADTAGLERFHLAGHDWGAIVGWATAAARPERVASLTALAIPHPAAFAAALSRGQAWRSAYIGLFWLPGVSERILLARGGAGMRTLLRVSGLSQPWRDAYTAAMLQSGALTGALAWYRAMPPFRRPSAVGRVRVPTCFVWASGDGTVSRAAAARTGDFVDGPYRLEVVEGSHWLPEDDPGRVAGLIAETVAGAGRPAGFARHQVGKPHGNDDPVPTPLMFRLKRALLRWALAAIAVPVAAEVADRLGRRLEESRGPNRVSRGLERGAVSLRRVQKTRRHRR